METSPTTNPFSDANAEDIARLFRSFATHATESLVGITRALIQSREFRWLERLLESGIVDEVGKQLGSSRIDLFNELLELEIGPNGHDATELLDRWAQALGITKEELQTKIATLANTSLVRSYMKRGASPNATSPGHNVADTALSTAMRNSNTALVIAMLDALAERNEIPLASPRGVEFTEPECFFDALLGDTYGTPGRTLISDHLSNTQIPESWRRELAYAVIAHKFPRVGGSVIVPKSYRQMLALAEFDSPQAFMDEIMSRGWRLTSMLSTAKDETLVAILAKVCSSGASIDEIPCAITDGGRPFAAATMLHAAVIGNNAQTTHMLLSAGADPSRVVTPYPDVSNKHWSIGLDAFEIATSSEGTKNDADAGDVRAVLESWRARQIVQAVVDRKRSGNMNQAHTR